MPKRERAEYVRLLVHDPELLRGPNPGGAQIASRSGGAASSSVADSAKICEQFACCAHACFRPVSLGDVVKDEDNSVDFSGFVANRGGAVVNRPLGPVLGNEDGMVGEADDIAFPENSLNGVLDRMPSSSRSRW